MKNVGRKCYHTLGGLMLIALYYLLDTPSAFLAYGALFAGTLLLDLIRLRVPAFNNWALSHLGSFLRPSEAFTLTGTEAYILGVALTFFLFDREIATAAILFLVFGDVLASMVGEAWGKTRFKGKSLEGTGAFLGAGFLIGIALRALGFGLAAPVILVGALTAAAVEFLSPAWLSDNLTIPLAAAAAMAVLV